jgi:CDP-glucose 4,6-dehydratase
VEDVVSGSTALAGAYRGKRVFVTGNTGFKGSWLALWLVRMGADVTGFSDAVPTDPSHFDRLGLDYPSIYGDIADEAAVRSAVAEARPDIVFHMAAQSLVRRSYSDPVETYRTNVVGTLALFEACRAAGVGAVVSATTDKVYRNREWDWGYREADELGGSDPYSASKSCVELMTRSYRESFLRDGAMLVASVRAGNVVGGGDWAEDRLIPDIMRAVYAGGKPRIRNPESTRPWQHVLDPLAGYLAVGAKLLAGDRGAADAWNFGPVGKARIRVKDVIAALKAHVPALEVEHVPETAGRHESGLLELDSTRAVSRLGWRPLWEDEMLERTVEWYRAFYEEGRLLSDDQLSAYCATLDRAG